MSINSRHVVALFLLALILRLAYLVEIRDTFYFDTLILDAWEYDHLAQALLEGEGWFSTPRMYVHGPLYPALLALLKLGGAGLGGVRLFQAVLGAFSCVLLYAIARRFFPAPTPLLAGLMAVGYWPFMLYNGELLATTLTIFIELLLLIQLVRCADRASYWSAAGAGVLLGLLVETRSNTLLLLPVALWWLCLRTRTRLLVPFCLGLCAVLTPFLVHNYIVQGSPLPFQGAWSFYMGNNPEADGTPYARQGIDWQRLEILPYEADMAASPADRGRFYLTEGLSFMVEQPLSYLHLLYRKFRLFWHAFEIPVSVDIHFYEAHSYLSYLNVFGFGVVAPLALVGLVWNWHRWRQYGLLYGFGLSYLVSGLLFTVCARYRLPAVPLLMLFAAEAVRQGALSLKGTSGGAVLPWRWRWVLLLHWDTLELILHRWITCVLLGSRGRFTCATEHMIAPRLPICRRSRTMPKMPTCTIVWARFTKRRGGLVKLKRRIAKPLLWPLITPGHGSIWAICSAGSSALMKPNLSSSQCSPAIPVPPFNTRATTIWAISTWTSETICGLMIFSPQP